MALPSAGLSLLGGLLDGSTAGDSGSQNLDACGMPVTGFWRAYQDHVWAFELGVGALVGILAVSILWAALRRNVVAVAVLTVLVLIPSAVPWLTRYDRSDDAGPKILECHTL